MKQITIIFLILTFQIIYAQDSVMIINYYENTNDTKKKEVYWVNKLDSTVKDGSYNSYYRTGFEKVSGTYSDGKKSGLWKFYDNLTNEVFLKYDFDKNNELLYKSTYSEKNGEFFTFQNEKIIKVDKRPYCPFFLSESTEILNQSLKGFQDYVSTSAQEKIHSQIDEERCELNLFITITKMGNLEAEVFRSNCKDLIIEEIIKIIENSPIWVPGESDGNKIQYQFNWSIKLNNNAP